MKVTIYRALFLNEASDIDLNNVGCHFSFSSEVDGLLKNSSLSGREKTGSYIYKFRATVDLDSINWNATLQSNRDYSHEYECVLNEGINLDLEFYNDDTYSWDELEAASTGNNQHGWVNSCDMFSEEEIEIFVNELKEWAEIA